MLTDDKVEALRKWSHPPVLVECTLTGVLIALGYPEDDLNWNQLKRKISAATLLQQAKALKVEDVDREV